MCEELLGYLLGALEPEEAAALEAKLAVDPELRRELELWRRRLGPLAMKPPMIDPPADLAERVCDQVADVRRSEAIVPASFFQPAAAASFWSRVDAATVIGLSLAALVLLVPVLASNRYRS